MLHFILAVAEGALYTLALAFFLLSLGSCSNSKYNKASPSNTPDIVNEAEATIVYKDRSRSVRRIADKPPNQARVTYCYILTTTTNAGSVTSSISCSTQ